MTIASPASGPPSKPRATEPGRAAPRRRGENQTRQTIADAAERIFSLNGYQGATVRQILAEAGVRSGLMSYYFPTKEALYAFVVGRKAPDIRAAFMARLPAVEGPTSPDAEACLRAYFAFFLETARDARLGDYLRLLARASADYGQTPVKENLARFDFIFETMLALLTRATPGASPERLRAGLLFMEATVTTLLVSTGLADHRLAGGAGQEALVAQLSGFALRGILG
jgi:AcrR family transcriptional regulator